MGKVSQTKCYFREACEATPASTIPKITRCYIFCQWLLCILSFLSVTAKNKSILNRVIIKPINKLKQIEKPQLLLRPRASFEKERRGEIEATKKKGKRRNKQD